MTFTEHTSAITGVAFTQTGRALLSSSLDGTVRAFDMARYRNFRTFTSPKPAQFSCLSIDVSGDLVAAGAQDTFDVYLWSLQTGRLLEVLRYTNFAIFVFSCNLTSLVVFQWTRRAGKQFVFQSESVEQLVGECVVGQDFARMGRRFFGRFSNSRDGKLDCRWIGRLLPTGRTASGCGIIRWPHFHL